MTPTVIPKAWGREVVITNGHGYCGKILLFNAGAIGSLHYHERKHETFYIRSGNGRILLIGDRGMGLGSIRTFQKGDIITLPPQIAHRVEADASTEIIEFSTPHDDADVFRV